MWTTALLISILRLAVRYWNLKRLFWDDAFAISAMLWLTVMAILNQLSCNAIYLMEALAEGRTPPTPFLTTPDQIITTIISQRKMQMLFMISFWNCLWSVKASLLMLYSRRLLCVQGYMRWWWVVVASCILTWLISILTNFLACIPLRRRFSLDPKGQQFLPILCNVRTIKLIATTRCLCSHKRHQLHLGCD